MGSGKWGRAVWNGGMGSGEGHASGEGGVGKGMQVGKGKWGRAVWNGEGQTLFSIGR